MGHIVAVPNLTVCSGKRPAGQFCKGTLKEKESTELLVSLVSSKNEFQVSFSGTLAGDFLAPVLRQFWKERHQSIIHTPSEMPSLGSQSCDSKRQPYPVPAVPGQKNGKQQRSSPVKTSSFSSEGSEVLRRRVR